MDSSMDIPVLEMIEVGVGYDHSSLLLRNVNLSLNQGQICGVLGPNGAGKSTLLKAIFKLDVLRTGKIIVSGSDIDELSRIQLARRTAYVPQDYNPLSRLTVFETVLLGRHPHKPAWAGDTPEDVETAREAMKATGIIHLEKRPFFELSGGEKRLVQISAALAQKTDIIILDEPGASLDFKHQIELWILLRELAESGKTIVLSTHEISIAGRYMDLALLIGSGKVRACSTPDQVFVSDLLTDVYDIPLKVSRNPGTGLVVTPADGR